MKRFASFLRNYGFKFIAALVTIAGVAVITSSYWLPAIGYWLAMPTTFKGEPAEAIIVHGGNPDRTLYGISLYKQHLAPEFWQTGYVKGEANLTNIVVGLNGIPKLSFHYLRTTSTWSDGTAIAQMIRERKLHNVIIVTDWWHSRRALCSTKQQLQGYPVIISFSSSLSSAGPENWWLNDEIRSDVLRELIKFVYYGLSYGMVPWGCS